MLLLGGVEAQAPDGPQHRGGAVPWGTEESLSSQLSVLRHTLGGEVGRWGGSEAEGGTPSPCSLHLITFATTGPHRAAHTGYFCFISFTSLPALPPRVRARQKQNSQQVWLILGPCF